MGVVNVGTVANDGTGDSIRAGGQKINSAFVDVVAQVIPPASISESMLDDGAASTRVIADLAVTAPKLAAGAIEAKLGYTPLNPAYPQTLFSAVTGETWRIPLGAANDYGAKLAIGRSTESLAQGLQISGGHPDESGDGTLFHGDGHPSWVGAQPSKNYSNVEFAIHPTVATLEVSMTSGGNTCTRLQGSATDSFWIGKKCYVGEGRYKVSAVAGDVITVTNLDGSPVSWGSTFTEVFRFGVIYGTGTCNVSGTAITKIAGGDPFPIYVTDPTFNFVLNGTARTLVSATPSTAVLSASLGTLTAVTYAYWLDIDDCISAFRIHATNNDSENLTISAKHSGYWIESLYGSFGKYRDIILSSGEVSSGVKRAQIGIFDDGRVVLGGDFARAALHIEPTLATTVNRLTLSGAIATASPILKSEGADTNIGQDFWTKGTGAITFKSTGGTKTEFQIFGPGGTSWLAAASDGFDAPTLSANGAASNIDIKLAPKGTGRVWVGAWASNADAAINGYITVKDSAGNVRKLATIA